MTDHEMVRLGDVCEVIAGTSFDRGLLSSDPPGVPVVLLSDIEEGDTESYYTGSYDEEHLVNSGDYLVSMSDRLTIEEWLGAQALYSQHLCRLVPFADKLNSRYMFYALRYIFGKLEDEEDGDLVVNNVSINALKDTMIPLPGLGEQELIVSVLDNAYDLMDLQIQQLDRTDDLITARFVEMFGDVEANTMDWPVRPLGELAERLKSRSILAKDRMPGDYPYYDSTGVVDHVSDFLFDEDLLLVAKVGSVLTSGDKDVARAVRGKLWASDLVHVLRMGPEVVPEYAGMVINLSDIGSRLRGGVMPKLPSASLNSIPIPCPPIVLQVEYVMFLRNIDSQSRLMSERLNDLIQICQGLNQRYFERAMSYE